MNVKKTEMYLLKPVILLLMLFSGVCSALTLSPGQAQTINLNENVDSVFISDPDVADYKVINTRKVVVHAKKHGVAEVTMYGDEGQILTDFTIKVDPFIDELNKKILREYPNSKVDISVFFNSGKATYVLNGTVADDDAKETIYQIVGSLVGGDSTSYDAETGLSASADAMLSKKKYYNVINKLDVLTTNQINVQLSVVEVEKSFSDSLGIEWSGASKGGGIGMFMFNGFQGGFDARNINTLISAINNDKVARILAQPNLSVLSGESASFLVGGEIPIPVESDQSISVTYKEYGIKLNISAKVEKQSRVRLSVANEISNVSGSFGFGNTQIPVLKTRKSSSTIELHDGQSFVIGGLLNEEDIESLGKIPFIGDIPVLGALARNAKTSRARTELIIVATVNLVKPVSSKSQIMVPYYNKTSSANLFINLDVDKKTREGRLENKNIMSNGGFSTN